MSGFLNFFSGLRTEVNSRARLGKFVLCLLIGCSTLFGYILASANFTMNMLLVGGGVFLLATGAATLNSLQEFHLDGRMERTRHRPLPRGELSRVQAGIQALLLLTAGLTTIAIATENKAPTVVAVWAVILYNVIYTPLKQKTVLAIVPGAICGALPPYIGWLAGGGMATCYAAALIVALFVLWQIPHFWLVVLSFQNDYQGNNLPSLIMQFGETGINRLLVTWIGSMAMVMLMFVGLSLNALSRVFLFANTGLMLLVILHGLVVRRPPNYRLVFIYLNVFLFLHMLIVAGGRMLV